MMNLKPLTGASSMSSIKNMGGVILRLCGSVSRAAALAERRALNPHEQPDDHAHHEVYGRVAPDAFRVVRAGIEVVNEGEKGDHPDGPEQPPREGVPEELPAALRPRALPLSLPPACQLATRI